MSVIFRHNNLSIILITLILISCPSIQTDEDVVIYSSVLNDSFQDTTAVGAYADGTILFKVKGHNEDSLCLIYPNGTHDFIDNIKECKHINSCSYELLNPHYIITYDAKASVGTIIDWKGNKIEKNFEFNKLSTKNNDGFLIMKRKNE